MFRIVNPDPWQPCRGERSQSILDHREVVWVDDLGIRLGN